VISDIESSQPLDDAKESVVGLSSNQVDVVNKYLKAHIVPWARLVVDWPTVLGFRLRME